MKTQKAYPSNVLLWLFATLSLLSFSFISQGQSNLSVTINASADDIEEYVTGALVGKYDSLSSDLEMTTEGNGQQIIGLRFPGITIPQGSIILRAYIQLRADEAHSGATNLVFKIQNSDNNSNFLVQKLSTRPFSTDSVKWDNIPAWAVGERTDKQKSPDLKSLVQSVVNRSGWASNNALAFVISGNGKRVADAWDDTEGARQPATLIIDYIAPKSSVIAVAASADDIEEYVNNIGVYDSLSSDLEMTTEGGGQQIIGLRFNNIPLPKGAVVTKAAIQFRADESHSGATNLVIKAQNEDNNPNFLVQRLSSRPLTSDSVKWDNIPAWTTGEQTANQRTPDLKNLVQTVINRSGWSLNNSLAFVLSGNGKRVADAWDDTEAARKPAELHLEYFVPTSKTVEITVGPDDMEEYVTGGLVGKYDSLSSDLEMTSEGGGQQIIGLRFQGLQIPNGVEIQQAFIQFRADENHTGTTNLAFKIDQHDNAVGFLTQQISTRTYGTDSVKWDNIQSWTAGERTDKQKSPDLKSLIQSVVNRSGWVSGNALAFQVSGTGKRVADAFEDSEASKRTAELTVTYLSGADGSVVGPKPKYPLGTYPITRNSNWKYNDWGVDLSTTNWTAKKYVADTAWSFGLSKLGYGVSGATTALSPGTVPGSKNTTYYLRSTFKAENVSYNDSLIFYANINDGAVFYVNGVEVYRWNMPAGAVNFSTLALNDLTTATGQNKYQRFAIKNTLVNFDTNTIAVELHAASATTAGVGFDMEIFGKTAYPYQTNFPILKNSSWSASDWGQDLGNSWTQASYDDNSWVHGNGVLGYGDPVDTRLFYGDDINNKNITIYFRKKFTVANLANVSDSLSLAFRRDDGAVVYINGVEVARSNMPSGAVSYGTQSGANTISETNYFQFKLPKSVLTTGTNVIAVEIHQDNGQSSDLTFDLELRNLFPVATTSGSGCSGSNDAHISCFTSIAPNTKNGYLNIPTSHKMQVLAQTGDAYTKTVAGIPTIPSNFDFTGFVPDNMTSSTKGHVSINHERGNGGVSMLDVSFNPTNKLWSVDSSRAIDFTAVRGTTSNCSGTVTPWGTVITCEETRASGDGNADGYQDYGWAVEIDPKTNSIPTYGTGTPQKLWAVGRVSHENVVVKKDSLTLYYGEDAGDGIVYKFVANQKMNLSAGTLYALRLDQPMVNNEPSSPTGRWVQVPNTTQSDRNNTFSLAKSLGGTTFNGIEDVEISPVDNMIYFTVKGQNRVYRFLDNGSTISGFETYVGGQSYTFNTGVVTTEPWSDGNDNLTFDDRGNLWVLQDGGQDHIWLVLNGHSQERPKVELFATTPVASEPTGMTFSPDFKYMFISIQEPSSANTPTGTDAAGKTVRFNKSTMLVISRSENLGGVLTDASLESVNQSAVSVFPNPTESQFTIRFTINTPGNVDVDIYDVTGKKASETLTASYANAGNYELPVSIRKSGIYLVKISTPNGVYQHKVVVK